MVESKGKSVVLSYFNYLFMNLREEVIGRIEHDS